MGNAFSGVLTLTSTNTFGSSCGCPDNFNFALEGGNTLGVGGDDSGLTTTDGAFFEGAVFAVQLPDATENAIQTNIVNFYGAR